MVVIIDYGMGNIFSIMHALEYLEVDSICSANPSDIYSATRLILPGVGSFEAAMNQIKKLHLDDAIKEAVTSKRIPILGICLGMQLLVNSSTEGFGLIGGLGLIDADTIALEKTNANTKIPHVGFDDVTYDENMKLFKNVPQNSDFYFTHSYKVVSDSNNFKKSICNYHQPFIAAFERNNIFGVQFHPEKSQTNGLLVLQNFLEFTC
jgi:imidazole glycerol-phosphate synthase subunit HisH